MPHNVDEMKTPDRNYIVKINEAVLVKRIDEKIREGIETTLNALLDEEADRIAGAARYERSEARKDTRAGHYERKLHTRGGEVPPNRSSRCPPSLVPYCVLQPAERCHGLTPCGIPSRPGSSWRQAASSKRANSWDIVITK